MVTCRSFGMVCPAKDFDCFTAPHSLPAFPAAKYSFNHLPGFQDSCLTCDVNDYRHNTIIFNVFIWCQLFNEYSSRKFEDINMFSGLGSGGEVFLSVSAFSVGMQIVLVEKGAEFVKTSPLSLNQWLISIGLGAGTLVIGALMRLIPIEEDPESFFHHSDVVEPQLRSFDIKVVSDGLV